MNFIKSPDGTLGSQLLTERLDSELSAGRRVLWLVSGGSNIPLSVTIMNSLDEAASGSLSILLSDERYGAVGHPDSNDTQLKRAGFNPKQATMFTVLQAGLDINATKGRYDTFVREAFMSAEVIIGQLGIGPDGHIAGILPNSPAVLSSDMVVAYPGHDFERLTLSFHALKRLSAAYVFAFGEAKEEALSRLRDEALPWAEQPAQVLKELPEAYIYNDQIGDTI